MGEAKRKGSKSKLASAAGIGAPQSKDFTLPERVLENLSHRYKDAWRYIDAARKDPSSVGLPSTWEPWCYLPINVATSLAHHLRQEEFSAAQAETLLLNDGRMLAGLAGWRMTKGVYVLDATMVQELFDSEVPDDLPDELFLHLPEWCVYLATPGLELLGGIKLHGFFAFVDDHLVGAEQRPPELNFLILIDPKTSNPAALEQVAKSSISMPPLERRPGADPAEFIAEVLKADQEYLCHPLVVELGRGSFRSANLDRLADNAKLVPTAVKNLHAVATGGTDTRLEPLRGSADLRARHEHTKEAAVAALVNVQLRFANLVLYLCSEDADVTAVIAPTQARGAIQQKFKRGIRVFSADHLARWDVGFRVGAKIRAAQIAVSAGPVGEGAAKRPHVRRAHWHTYWKGPKDDQALRKRRVVWLHPMLINVESADDLVPTLHR